MKKILAVLLSVAMLFSAIPATAFATETKNTQMNVVMLNESKDVPSICDALFAEKADLTADGENVKVKLYVAYPVPGFPEEGKDGTLKNITAEYGGKVYNGESDITTKPLMTAKVSNPMFGTVAGTEIPAQTITFTLPREALKENGIIKINAFVNVFMKTNVVFRMQMTNVSLPEAETAEADKTLLNSKIAEAEKEAAKKDVYTEASLKVLNEKIKEAKTVAEDKKATEENVKNAIDALNNAISKLEEKETKPLEPQYAYGKTKMNITMLDAAKDKASICDALFAAEAELESAGENAKVTLYVAYPVPKFPQMGKDGTLKDVKAVYNGTEYMAESDITTKPLMTVKTSNPMFGTVEGEKVTAQTITFTLPKEALKEGGMLPVTAYVNVMMNKNVDFRMKMENIVLPEADKTLLAKKVEIAKTLETEGATKESAEALNKAIAGADAVIADRNATDEAVSAAIEALDIAVHGLKPEEAEKPEPSVPDYRNLEDGVYIVQGKMITPKGTVSISDKAVNHNVKLTVKDGKYYITLDFKGIDFSGRYGHLGELEYFLSGYTKNEYNYPEGKKAKATVEKFITDKDGNIVEDEYGTDYPDLATFEMIPEALEDGMVPLQVYVPVMEDLVPGLGTQQVYLSLDWDTVQKTTVDDEAFIPETEESVKPGVLPEIQEENNGTVSQKPAENNNAENNNAEKTDSKNPVTGDESSLYLWLIAVLAAGTAVYGLGRKKEK